MRGGVLLTFPDPHSLRQVMSTPVPSASDSSAFSQPDSKLNSKCISCTLDAEEQKRIVYTDKDLKVVLRTDNQCWLGRGILVPLKHISPESLYASHPEVLVRIAAVIALLTKVYKEAFGMKMFNIAQLGNLTTDDQGKPTSEDKFHHVHFHLIPRYDAPVTFNGREFHDKQWGKALNIDPKAGLEVYKPTDAMVAAIVSALRKEIAKELGEMMPDWPQE